MKKAIVVFVFGMILFCSCTASNERKIVGTWTDIEDHEWIFSADKKLSYYNHPDDIREYKYDITDTKLTFLIETTQQDTSLQAYDISISSDGKTLILTGGKQISGWRTAGPGWPDNRLIRGTSQNRGSVSAIPKITTEGTAINSTNSRAYIKNVVRDWGSCRNVAITKLNGDVALNYRNASAYQNIPRDMADALKEFSEKGYFIEDIELTDNGEWLILGDSIMWSDNLPEDLIEKMKDYNRQGETITSVTFNDKGVWMLITKNYFSTSQDYWTDWLKTGIERFGTIWAVCITDDSAVAVFKDGFKYDGNVPDSLKNALRDTTVNVAKVKVSGASWFFADENGRYQYDM
jgi:hypothetical protein